MKDQRWAVVSDIHLGHKGNDCQKMVDALDASLIYSDLMQKLDVLVFAGDVFEMLLELNHPDVGIIDLWIARVLTACHKHKVKFRVLNGTQSHDRDQSERFETIRQVLGLTDLDYKYIHDMEVEYMADLDTHVLYIRDRGEGHDSQETYSEALELMRAKGVLQVDVAVMHGMFEYQATQAGISAGTHVQEQYERIVRQVIFIGHVHTHTRNGKVVAQGSHDRLRHSEEEAKGFVIAEFMDNKNYIHFVENKLAHQYRNVYAYGMDVEETLAHVDTCIQDLKSGAFVCVEAEKAHPIFTNMAQLSMRYPHFTWSKRPKDKNTQGINEVGLQTDVIEWHPIHVSATNIKDIVMKRMAVHGLSESDYAFIANKVSELT